MKEAAFNEVQKFTQRWLLVVVSAVFVILVGAALLLFITKKTGIWLPIQFVVCAIIFLVGFKSLKLECKITGDEIAYRFYPFQLRFRIIPKSEILHVEVITYRPLAEYGGWGIRIGRNGMAYNVKGDKGALIKRVSQKNILIGTSMPEEMASFLRSQRYP